MNFVEITHAVILKEKMENQLSERITQKVKS